jgi:hypothetical protein
MKARCTLKNGHSLAVRLDELRLVVAEADRRHGLLAMERAWPALVVDPAPVIDAVGGVGVLLDLEDEIAGADGMDASAGQEHRLALLGLERAEQAGELGRADGLLELLPRYAVLQAHVDFCLGRGLQEVPHFGLRLALLAGRRVDLHAQVVLAVE